MLRKREMGNVVDLIQSCSETGKNGETMIVAVNYANAKYRKAQKVNSKTAITKGKVDKVISYSPRDLDADFRQKNSAILLQKRGNGYWLWKPYIILKTLREMQEGDYLVYLDAGAFYINSVKWLTVEMEKDGQEIMSFELPFQEKRFTKRDAFIGMQCNEEKYTESNQRMATMIVFKKCESTLHFVKEWLYFGQKEEIITDRPNCTGHENDSRFIDHRHDQSIFSLLCKKHGIKAYGDPSQFGRFPELFYDLKLDQKETPSNVPQIVAMHRKGEVDARTYREQLLFAYAPKKMVEVYLRYFNSCGSSKKIAVLTDNMPIREDAYGYGMYKVVNRLLEALGNCVDTVICTDRHYSEEKVNPSLKEKLCVENGFHDCPVPFLARMLFLISLVPTVYKLKKKKIKHVFIPLGADYRELERAYLLSAVYRFHVSIYVVDDFADYYKYILGNRDDSQKIIKKILRYMRKIDSVFAISEGMKIRIQEIYGRTSHILPVPYDYKELKKKDVPNYQIMFVGSINELYISGLRDIAQTVDRLNKVNNWKIGLRFTYRTAGDVKHILGNYECIQSARLNTEEELREEMHKSLFCLMPYSDNRELEVMQATSFPSKMVEYLSSARSIVIYGNQKDSAFRYFQKYKLPTVIDRNNKNRLEECIIFHMKENIDYSGAYRKVLKKYHSYKNVKTILMNVF